MRKRNGVGKDKDRKMKGWVEKRKERGTERVVFRTKTQSVSGYMNAKQMEEQNLKISKGQGLPPGIEKKS